MAKSKEITFKIGKQYLESHKKVEAGQIWASFSTAGYQLVKISYFKDKEVTADSPYVDAKLLNNKLEFVRDVIVDIYSLHEIKISR
jgi:hypothetical protein